MVVQTWHGGERTAQEARGYTVTSNAPQYLRNYFGPDQRAFYPILNFLPIASLDADGRPWMSILAAADGRRGFCVTADPHQSLGDPAESELHIHAKLALDDPLRANLHDGVLLDGKRKIAGIGVELLNRRRNKLAGYVARVMPAEKDDGEWELVVHVEDTLGNCPKYINTRVLVPTAQPTQPVLVVAGTTHLPSEAIELISTADAVFLSTVYHSISGDEGTDGSRVGANIRGGKPGFVRFHHDQSTGETTLYLPDYGGNRYMQSIGNIQTSGLAGLAVPVFGLSSSSETTSTRILYVTGDADILYGNEASSFMRSAHAIIRIRVRKFKLIHDALSVVVDGTSRVFDVKPTPTDHASIGWSPYNPQIWPLISEAAFTQTVGPARVSAKLEKVIFHSATLATFTWSVPTQLVIRPGQYIILDMRSLMNQSMRSYTHMARWAGDEKNLNDSGIRSYTVSRVYPPSSEVTRFDVTLRLSLQGAITPSLFQRGAVVRGQLDDGVVPDDLQFVPVVPVIGVEGHFFIPDAPSSPLVHLAYAVNGIGITPLLAHLNELVTGDRPARVFAIVVVRADEVLIVQSLIRAALGPDIGSGLYVEVHLVSSAKDAPQTVGVLDPPNLRILSHIGAGRFTPDSLSPSRPSPNSVYFQMADAQTCNRAFICGSPAFEQIARQALQGAGVTEGLIVAESFAY